MHETFVKAHEILTESRKGSQLKELCWKNWKKSPENPENQKPPGVPTGGYPAKSTGEHRVGVRGCR